MGRSKNCITVMNEIVYITDYCHTGHLKEAANELNSRSREVGEYCVYRLGQVDPREKPEYIPLSLRLAVSPGDLPKKDREEWQKAERELMMLMKAAHIMRSLVRTEMRLGEMLQEVPPFLTYHDAFLFFKSANWRLDYLLSPQICQRLDTARFASYSFIESWALKRAIFEGKYLTQPS